MSVLSFDPAGHGGVSTVGADPTPFPSAALRAVNTFKKGQNRRATVKRVTENAFRNVLKNQQTEPPPLADPFLASGDIGPDVEGTIVAKDEGPIIAVVDPESITETPTRGRAFQRSNSSPSSSPSRSQSRLRRAASFAGRAAAVAAGTALGGPVGGAAVAGIIASRGSGKDGSPVTPKQQQNDTAPGSDEQDVAGAHAPDACTEKASSVVSKISQGNEALYDIIGDMQKRIATHKEISERVRAMKAELERLRELEKNMPQPTTPEGIAQKALATEAIESCSANMSGMESAVDELVSTIRRLKQQIMEIGDTDYDITETLGITRSADAE